MEQYGKILIIAMPIFLLLIITEKLYGILKGDDQVPLMDSVSSISSGITNAVKDVLGISLTLISYEWLVSKIGLYQMEANWLAYIIAFIVIDFYGYWTHRWSHQINFSGTNMPYTTAVKNLTWLVRCAKASRVL
jgi:sterol desaturase/sphingolipid hydroxylase (fatty acid hydroxylase superfamily)